MNDLEKLIVSAQNFDENAMNEIIKKFDLIIDKYVRLMKNDEDFKSELILYLIDLIHKINLSKFRILNDYSLINYINKSLYHRYIYLSVEASNIRKHENNFENEDIEAWLEIDYETQDTIENIITDSIMKNTITEREYSCVFLMVITGLSSSEAAKILGISRQTANEAKLRGLKKLKNVLDTEI